MTESYPFLPIKAAAIRFVDTDADNQHFLKILVGRTYARIYADALDLFLAPVPHAEGFIDTDGNFITPEAAAQIAFMAGQISKRKKKLRPEDLI